MILACPNCGNKKLVDAKIVETGVVTTYQITRNCKSGLMQLVAVNVDCSTENEHAMMLECPKCKQSVDISAAWAGAYHFITADEANNPKGA